MKFLTIIYYDTFARFFSAIEDAVKLDDPQAEFLHLAIFPSGWLYMKSKGRNVMLLPWQINTRDIQIVENSEILDKISYYHAATGVRHGNDYIKKLRKRANDYLGTMARIVEDFRPDIVLFSGDTRIACEALKHHLDDICYKGKRYFFEQGPNGTTIFDSKGVNANCSFRKQAATLTGEGYTPEPPIKQIKFKRNPIFRGLDYALIGILRPLGLLPPEWDTMSLEKISETDYLECIKNGRGNSRVGAREILVALQVPDDANNIHHNPLKLSDVELVGWVLRANEKLGLTIRVREHPLYRRRYSAEMYHLLASNRITVLSESALDDDLKNAAVVVTVNSMTGLDAYLRKIPVVTLGNAFYDHLPGIERVRDQNLLGDILSELVSSGLTARLGNIDPGSIFAEMRARYFIPGHYLDADLRAPESIAEILANSTNISQSESTPSP